jgi:TatA/E family protein of Tat protein translocase
MFRNPSADVILVIVVLVLFFGPKRLPGVGRHLGQGLREFKEGITGDSKPDEQAERPELTRASETPPATTSDRDAAEVASSEPRS